MIAIENDQLTTCPFTVLIDGREKAPYQFTGLRTDAAQGRKKIVVPTQWAYLHTGDYTAAGMEDVVCVERKSLSDLYSTLGSNRDRFRAEHERMAEMKRACVIIESTWYEIIGWPPERSRLNPKVVMRTSISWFVKYGVPWFTCEDRRFSEICTFRFLEKAWREFGVKSTEESQP